MYNISIMLTVAENPNANPHVQPLQQHKQLEQHLK